MTSMTVTIDREHRDAIFQEIAALMHSATDLVMYFDSATDSLGDRQWIAELAKMLPIATGLLEQLGWQKQGTADQYHLELDDGVVRFMARMERHARGSLEDSWTSLRRARALYAKRGWHPSDEEWAQVQQDTRRLIDLDLDSIDVARRVRRAYNAAAA